MNSAEIIYTYSCKLQYYMLAEQDGTCLLNKLCRILISGLSLFLQLYSSNPQWIRLTAASDFLATVSSWFVPRLTRLFSISAEAFLVRTALLAND